MKTPQNDKYEVVLPSGTGLKEIRSLLERRRAQVLKAIEKLKTNPTDYKIKGIEKLKNSELGDFSIRVSSGDRIFYDVDMKRRKVILLRAGKHDLYKIRF